MQSQRSHFTQEWVGGGAVVTNDNSALRKSVLVPIKGGNSFTCCLSLGFISSSSSDELPV